MKTSDFYYDLPQELIAQTPIEPRDASRLLVYHKNSTNIEHKHFYDVIDYLQKGDVLVINNTKVIPARLFGEREGTQAKIEILLLKRREKDLWETLVKPGKKARPGTRILFGGGLLVCRTKNGRHICRNGFGRKGVEKCAFPTGFGNFFSGMFIGGICCLPDAVIKRTWCTKGQYIL